MRCTGENQSFWQQLTKKRDRLVCHILMHNGIINMIMEGRLCTGENGIGKPRLEYGKKIQRDGCAIAV